MKKKITRFLMLALALVWAIPQTSAQEYDISVNTTADWVNKFSDITTDEANFPSTSAKGMAIGLNGLIITHEPAGSDVITGTSIKPFYRIGNGILNKFTCGYTNTDTNYPAKGSLVANDANNNIIYFNAKSFGGQITRVQVYKAEDAANTSLLTNLSKVNKNTNVDILGTPHFIWAEGNCYDGTGYVWYVQNSASKAVRVTIVNGILQTDKYECTLKDASGNAITLSANGPHYMKKYDEGKLFIHDRGGKLYDVAVTGTEGICTPITISESGNITSSNGADLVVFKGHKLLFVSPYNATDKYNSKFRIYDLTDNNKLLAEIDQFKVTDNFALNSSSFGIWVRAIQNSSDTNKLDIYTYCPGYGAAKYSITATEKVVYTDPVQNLKATRSFNADATQNAVLTWTAPATGADHVTGYAIYRGETQIKTVGSDVLTYTDTEALTASTVYKVVPNYDTDSDGTEQTVTIAPYEYKAPTGLALTHYDGYARVTVTYGKCSDVSGLHIRYDIIRDGATIVKGLTQAEYVDTYIPEGSHAYTVEAVYYIPDANGNYTVEIARERCATDQTVTVSKLNSTLVNYTLEEVYNYEVWDIWKADQENGAKLPENFNPDLKDGENWIDAEHYRQGALVTDANGKKWWYISQKTNSITADEEGGTSGGILKISAEEEDLKVGGNAELLLSGDIKNGQSVGIASDEYGNFLIRGWYKAYDDASTTEYNDSHNFATDLDNVIIYNSADLTTPYVVDLSGIDFNADPGSLNNNQWNSERIDYYRVSGNLMDTSYLYVVTGYGGSRTYTKVQMIKSGDAITVGEVEQYTPTTLDNGTVVKVNTGDGAENYAFPIEETTAGSKGVIYQKRSLAYLYLPEELTSNKDIYTSTGKIANTGGTTAKMTNANDVSAAQLFLITPQSFHSRNAGSFTVGLVPNNKFENAVIPIANFVQKESDNFDVNAEANNANANWLFAEWDVGDANVTGDENLYIYQYVPGIRIAKYRLYGSMYFHDTAPDLTISTAYDEKKGDITHFTATASWSTPADYNGPGDYAISHYKVELLDKNNNVIDTENVTATESLDAATYESQNYTVTFNSTRDLSNPDGVETGGTAENYFVDDNSLYTVRVTTVYNLRQVMQNTTTADNDYRNSATQTAQAQHSYGTTPPAPSIKIYKGNDGTSVAGLYRMELDLMAPDAGDRVSHYELYYTRGKRTWTQQTDGSYTHTDGDTTVRVTDFILVTSSLTDNSVTALKGQDVIPGDVVRNEQHAVYLEKNSEGKSYAVFFYDSNKDYGTTAEGTEWGNGLDYDPTEWTYTVKAVYADDNTLLRKTTEASITPTPGEFTPTGVGEITDVADGLKAYPIPADTELNVMSGQAIDTVGIYSTTGAEVKRVAGNGEMRMTIDIEDLASGYYFLKVNNLPPVKIIVR